MRSPRNLKLQKPLLDIFFLVIYNNMSIVQLGLKNNLRTLKLI